MEMQTPFLTTRTLQSGAGHFGGSRKCISICSVSKSQPQSLTVFREHFLSSGQDQGILSQSSRRWPGLIHWFFGSTRVQLFTQENSSCHITCEDHTGCCNGHIKYFFSIFFLPIEYTVNKVTVCIVTVINLVIISSIFQHLTEIATFMCLLYLMVRGRTTTRAIQSTYKLHEVRIKIFTHNVTFYHRTFITADERQIFLVGCIKTVNQNPTRSSHASPSFLPTVRLLNWMYLPQDKYNLLQILSSTGLERCRLLPQVVMLGCKQYNRAR